MARRNGRTGYVLGAAAFFSAASGSGAEHELPATELVILGTAGGTALRRAKTDIEGLGQTELGVMLRWHNFELGAIGQCKTLIFQSWFGAYGVAGISHFVGPIRMDGLGLFGWHYYPGWGKDVVFGDNPGATATIPAWGARLSLSYEIRDDPFLALGLYGSYEADLLRQHVAYSYTETPWLDLSGDAQPQKVSDEQEIGANFISVGIVWVVGIGL